MSKASEWVKTVNTEPPSFESSPSLASVAGRLDIEKIKAEIARSGCLGLSLAGAVVVGCDFHSGMAPGVAILLVTPEDALALARWIIDTFDDEATS